MCVCGETERVGVNQYHTEALIDSLYTCARARACTKPRYGTSSMPYSAQMYTRRPIGRAECGTHTHTHTHIHTHIHTCAECGTDGCVVLWHQVSCQKLPPVMDIVS